jgi:hypothetical protein
MDSDRRQFSRNEPAKLVYARFGKANGGIVLNASPGGLCFQSVAPTQLSSVVELIVSPSIKESIGITGRIVWTDQDGKMGGLEFVDPPPEVKDRLMEWLLPQLPGEITSPATLSGEKDSQPHLPVAAFENIPALNATPSPVAEQVTAPVFELPRNYRKTSSVPRMFGGLSDAPDFSVNAPFQEIPKSRNWFARAVANLILFGLLLILPAVYIYNFHPLLAYSLIDRGEKLYSKLENLAGNETSNQATPQNSSVPKEDALPGSTAIPEKENSASDTNLEKPISSEPAATTGTELRQQAPVSGAEHPLASAEAQTPITNPKLKTAPVGSQNTFTQQQIPKHAIRQRENLRPVSQTKLPVDPNDPNELWLAVGQGDTNAEVTLANLYLTGRLVKKNCDQGRVLLTAASKKGNAEAISELRNLLRNGCQ